MKQKFLLTLIWTLFLFLTGVSSNDNQYVVNYHVSDNSLGANYGQVTENDGRSTQVEYYVQLPSGSQQRVNYKFYKQNFPHYEKSPSLRFDSPPSIKFEDDLVPLTPLKASEVYKTTQRPHWPPEAKSDSAETYHADSIYRPPIVETTPAPIPPPVPAPVTPISSIAHTPTPTPIPISTNYQKITYFSPSSSTTTTTTTTIPPITSVAPITKAPKYTSFQSVFIPNLDITSSNTLNPTNSIYNPPLTKKPKRQKQFSYYNQYTPNLDITSSNTLDISKPPKVGSYMTPVHAPPWAPRNYRQTPKFKTNAQNTIPVINVSTPTPLNVHNVILDLQNVPPTLRERRFRKVNSFSSLIGRAPKALKVKLLNKKVDLLKDNKPFKPSPRDPSIIL